MSYQVQYREMLSHVIRLACPLSRSILLRSVKFELEFVPRLSNLIMISHAYIAGGGNVHSRLDVVTPTERHGTYLQGLIRFAWGWGSLLYHSMKYLRLDIGFLSCINHVRFVMSDMG